MNDRIFSKINQLNPNDGLQNARRIANSLENYRLNDIVDNIRTLNSISKQSLTLYELSESVVSLNKYTNQGLQNIGISSRKLDLGNKIYNLRNIYPKEKQKEEINQNEEISEKIVKEIFPSEQEKDKETIIYKDSAIITLSPINDKVLQYLLENPQAFYQLTYRDFEKVMAEIYSRLGCKVELTRETRDGGKDIIIRKPEILGDFIYYVECKKYSKNKPVGVGIVRDLTGVISMDKVNGGIIATTSYFTKDAADLIKDKNLNYQIQLHDFTKIKEMLKRVV